MPTHSMKADYTTRWMAGDGLSAHLTILRAIQAKQFDRELSPFGEVEHCRDMRGFPAGSLQEITGCGFHDVDFSKSDFTSVRIEACAFRNVRFDRANLSRFSDFGNHFDRCSFLQTAITGAIVGGQGTRFSDCIFDHCVFRGTSFVRPEFDRCNFTSCDLKGVDFNGSSFVETAFTGKLQDVWFRGGFAYPSETTNFGMPRKNTMLRVSLAGADLRWVTFSDDCDLSTVTLPTDGQHRLYDHWKSRIEDAIRTIEYWEEGERKSAMNYLRTLQVHAETQDWYILNSQEVVEELGEDVGGKVLHSLGRPAEEIKKR